MQIKTHNHVLSLKGVISIVISSCSFGLYDSLVDKSIVLNFFYWLISVILFGSAFTETTQFVDTSTRRFLAAITMGITGGTMGCASFLIVSFLHKPLILWPKMEDFIFELLMGSISNSLIFSLSFLCSPIHQPRNTSKYITSQEYKLIFAISISTSMLIGLFLLFDNKNFDFHSIDTNFFIFIAGAVFSFFPGLLIGILLVGLKRLSAKK